jgi:hypothetical protein
MALSEKEYQDLRSKVIQKYKVLYKDSLAMDICEVPKDVRIRMLQDETYLAKTKAIKANLFVQQLETLDSVLADAEQSTTVLKALEMKQQLLLEELNVTKDESNALNVTFVAMSKSDFEAMETVEINEGGNSAELGADFGGGEDGDSFESRMKARTQEKLKEKQSEEGEE